MVELNLQSSIVFMAYSRDKFIFTFDIGNAYTG
jgi:hypothetical protein